MRYICKKDIFWQKKLYYEGEVIETNQDLSPYNDMFAAADSSLENIGQTQEVLENPEDETPAKPEGKAPENPEGETPAKPEGETPAKPEGKAPASSPKVKSKKNR